MYDMLCAGCGHRTAMMILDEIIKEKNLKEKIIMAFDVACCSLLIDYVDYDAIMCAHGRVLDVTKGYKLMRDENIVISYMGDGAAYSIGIEEMVHSARRNDSVLAIIINNGLYSMTGGQVSPTYIGGDDKNGAHVVRPYDGANANVVGADSIRPYDGANENNGAHIVRPYDGATVNTVGAKLCEPVLNDNAGFKIENVISNFPISYFARAALTDKENIDIAKKYINVAFEKYMKSGGFNLVELLSPCPTNYKLKPIDMVNVINNEWTKVYKIGEFVNNV